MTYLRLYSSGKQAVTVSLSGCWLSSTNLPNYEMDGDDGTNGNAKLEATVNFDDIELVGDSLLNSLGQAALQTAKKKLTNYSYQAAAEAAVGLLL